MEMTTNLGKLAAAKLARRAGICATSKLTLGCERQTMGRR
jgi:hypothetical protein